MSDGIVSVVVGTAGHIDHGKSSLVRWLTGINPDRLKEEQDTGMTIDLGFAPFDLPDGRRVGVIDVPGHERFVKNMVAGATGLDLVILVVAADDGVMPQTREHLEILSLLGLEAGLIALTKIDLPGVDDDLLELLELELEELVEGTFLEGAPVQRIDSLSGRGCDDFRKVLLEQIDARAALRAAQREGAYRQPIQRVFSARGFGTVVTGVPLHGSLSLGDKVEVITATGTHKGRVRGLQAYGRTVEQVQAGHSSAVNVTDVDFKSVQRGDTLATPGVYTANTLFEARLEVLASQSRPVEQRQTVRVHLGTAEILGEVVVLDAAQVEPGAKALCQLRLRTPVVAAAGDRYVLRRHSPMETLGGGTIIGPSRWRLKPFKGFVLQRLAAAEGALDDLGRSVVVFLDQQSGPVNLEAIARGTQRPRSEIEGILPALLEQRAVTDVSGGKGQAQFVSEAGFLASCERVTDALEALHAERPLVARWSSLAVRQATKQSAAALRTCLTRLVESSEVDASPATLANSLPEAQGGGETYARAGFVVTFNESQSAFAAALLARYAEEAFDPPPRSELVAALANEDVNARDGDDVLTTLGLRGELVPIGDELVLSPERYAECEAKLRALAAREPFTASAFRGEIGSTRRYAIPLLEHFDQRGLTKRQGDVRVLA